MIGRSWIGRRCYMSLLVDSNYKIDEFKPAYYDSLKFFHIKKKLKKFKIRAVETVDGETFNVEICRPGTSDVKKK